MLWLSEFDLGGPRHETLGHAAMRLLLTLLFLTLPMLWSMAFGSPEAWMLLAIGAGWIPFATLFVVPIMTGQRRRSRAMRRRRHYRSTPPRLAGPIPEYPRR
jgi:hypothetical protein